MLEVSFNAHTKSNEKKRKEPEAEEDIAESYIPDDDIQEKEPAEQEQRDRRRARCPCEVQGQSSPNGMANQPKLVACLQVLYVPSINHLQKPKLALQTLQSQLESLAMSSFERREEEFEN